MDNEIIIRAEGLTKEVPSPAGPLTILDDISFAMRRSESLAVVGVSGSGKSTLLGLLAGLDSPTRGRVVFDGVDLGELNEDGRAEFRRQRVGFVFQSFHLLPSLTAIENVMLPMELSGHRSAADSARTALDRVGLVHRLRHYPNQLSGGEQQRVAIARAFGAGAKVLFADEPTGNLDRKTGAAIGELLFSLNASYGTTLILVTHDETIAAHCARHMILEGGGSSVRRIRAYTASDPHEHRPPLWRGKGAALGVLLTNLGTPTAPTPRAVRHFLREFLSDPRVVELPRWVWLPVLHGIVLRLRPRYAARAYARIWGEEGSPLLTHSEHQAARLTERLAGDGVKVVLGMRYGQPSIRSALEALRAAGVGRLLVLPLFPQYSAVTTASVFDAVARTLGSWRRLPEVRMPMGYHDDPGYITAVTHAIRMAFEAHGVPDRLLFSFHGLPRDAVERGDPYGDQCQATARLVADSMGLQPDRWQVAFQSRVGPRAWLAPYTLETLTAWARAGVRSVQVVCPGFAADCLETLEEIDIRYREAFLAAGGEDFHYIPALNDSPQHIEVLWQLVARHGLDAAPGSPGEPGVYGLGQGDQQDHEQDHEAER